MARLRLSRLTIFSVLLAAAVIPYFINLGVSSIWDANEAFYAQTPREMIDAHDYVDPSFNFQPRFNKPVLSYWEVAAVYRLFGVSERSERLPIALGGMILIAAAFGMARLIGGNQAGLIAALVLATSPRVLLLARRIIIDVHTAMFASLVLWLFALSEARPRQRRVYLLAMYVAAGFGVLTKGPVAVFLPALTFFIYLVSQKRLRDLRAMMLPLGAAISLAIVIPWYYLVYREHGWTYITSFVVGENLGRYAEAVGEQARGWFYYVPVMLADLFPWTLFVPAALWWGFRRRANPIVRLLFIWTVAIVAFFSLSGTKEDLYILPVVTAEAALIGACVNEMLERPAPWNRWVLAGTSVLMAIVSAGMLWGFGIVHRYSLSGATFISVVLLLGAAFVAIAAVRGQLSGAVAAIAASCVVAAWCIVLTALPDFERYKPVRPFAAIIQGRATEGGIVGYYRSALPSMVFYLNRPIMEVAVPDHLRAAFYSRSDVHFIMPETEYDQIRDRLPVATYVLARRPMFELRPKNFLEGSELPQFVLDFEPSGRLRVEMNSSACPIPCNVCGSTDVEELASEDRDGRPLRTTICRKCGLVWSNPRPAEDEVRRYYSREYRMDYKGHATPSLRHVARSGRGALNRYRELAGFLKRGDRVLDAGAGGGEVVYVLRKAGFDAMGLEPDQRYAGFARDVLGVPVETGFIQDFSFPSGRFDAITMYHALEHVEDPVGILTTLRRWMSDRGILLIEVPNVEARCIHPRHRFHFAHFYNFNRATLEAAGRKAGLAPVQTTTSPDGGNVITVFRAGNQGDTARDGLERNYERVRDAVRSHTPAGYYFSATPYVGPLSRLRAFLKDRAAARGRRSARDVLDGLIAQT